MDSNNFVNWHQLREYNDTKCVKFQRQMHINDSLIRRLGLEFELEGHNGCVNCLEWNQKGTLLASGSDDVQIIIWDALRHKQVQCLQSGHQGNIFSLKFIPESNDNILCSGAADCKVRVHDLTSSETTLSCCCHMGRVKRLAVAPNSPFMFWSSAEDGLVLEYDLRQRHRCSTVCNNVLINLLDYNGANAEVKCIAINPVRPEMLAVGANDPFVRVYDRRMISPQTIQNRKESVSWDRRPPVRSVEEVDSSSSFTSLPVGCVKYFIAGHLLRRRDKKRYRAYASTYISFSPDGTELLSNLGSEQIYLFDVLKQSKPKFLDLDSIHKTGSNSSGSSLNNGYHLNGTTNVCSTAKRDVISQNCQYYKKSYSHKTQLPSIVDAIKTKANEKFECSDYTFAIRLYNKAISLCPRAAVLYGNRAMAYMRRKWEGDLYAALLDCYSSLNIDPDYFKVHYRLVRCLYDLDWFTEANHCFQSFKTSFPDLSDTESCHSLRKDIEKALNSSKTEDKPNMTPTYPLTAINSYTVVQNFNDSPGNPYNLLNAANNQEKEWRIMSSDYKKRFCGHCNTTTDIKEANFFGSDGQYIIAGSDDGSFFVWDRQTTNIVRVMNGDESIVNCLQPHPTLCLLATSGIDQVVRLWSPRPEDGQKDKREIENCEDAATANQKRMNTDPLEVMLANMGYRVPTMLDSEDDDSDHMGVQCRTS